MPMALANNNSNFAAAWFKRSSLKDLLNQMTIGNFEKILGDLENCAYIQKTIRKIEGLSFTIVWSWHVESEK